MSRRRLTMLLAAVAAIQMASGSSGRCDFLTERWGNADRCGHRGAVSLEGGILRFDLSALPRGTRVRRAVLAPAVTREGYFVLAIMIGLRGFARKKRDPMMKVREAWGLFGERTDKAEVDRLLGELGATTTLEKVVRPSAAGRSGERQTPPK